MITILRPGAPVYEIMEGSSPFCLQSRRVARARTRLDGDPLCLWVGRLNPNKDPVFIGIGFAVPIENAAAAAGIPPF